MQKYFEGTQKIKIFLLHIYVLIADVTNIIYNNILYKYIIFFMAHSKKKGYIWHIAFKYFATPGI